MVSRSFKEKPPSKKMLQYMFMKTRENNLWKHAYYDESLQIHSFISVFKFNHWHTSELLHKIHLQIFNFLIKRILLPIFCIKNTGKSPNVDSILS